MVFPKKTSRIIEKFEKRTPDLKSARKNESKNGPTFHFRDWEGKNTHNPLVQDQDDQAQMPNQEMLLIKVVSHTSMMTKKQLRVTKPLRRS